jgi:predicted nucleotidyltransferase
MKEIDPVLLSEVTKRVAETVHPEKIILFGSHVWGTPTEDSDLDIFVIVSCCDQPAYRRARPIYKALRGLKVPIDIIRAEVERSKNVATSLVKKVMEEGRILHG